MQFSNGTVSRGMEWIGVKWGKVEWGVVLYSVVQCRLYCNVLCFTGCML